MSKCVNIKHSPRWVETSLLGLKVLALHTVKYLYPSNSVAQPIRYKLTFSGNNMILIYCPLTAGTQFTDSGDKMKTTLTGY